MFSDLLRKDLFKGKWSLAKSYFKQNYCHACHTRFAVFFPLPSCCVSSLVTNVKWPVLLVWNEPFFPKPFHVGVTPGETRLNKLPSIFFCWSNITLRDHVSRSLLCSDNVIILTFHLLPASVTKACKNSQTSGDFQVSIIDQSQGKMSCAVFYEPSETSSSSLWNQMSFSSVNILDGGWSCVEQYKLFPVWDVYDSRQTQDIVASNFWVGTPGRRRRTEVMYKNDLRHLLNRSCLILSVDVGKTKANLN